MLPRLLIQSLTQGKSKQHLEYTFKSFFGETPCLENPDDHVLFGSGTCNVGIIDTLHNRSVWPNMLELRAVQVSTTLT